MSDARLREMSRLSHEPCVYCLYLSIKFTLLTYDVTRRDATRRIGVLVSRMTELETKTGPGEERWEW
jgi:hypothetical protein